VLEFNLFKSLSYTVFTPRPDLIDKPENYSTMKNCLTDDSGTTVLEIFQEDGRPGAVQELTQGEENPILASLKNLIEENL